MSGYGGGAKCPKCNKTVYFNEEVLAAGKKWHKACFKCFQCNKALDSMTMADRGGELYCKVCHKKNFANYEMVKEVQVDPTPSSGQGDKCGRCGKTVYHAEKVIGAGRTYHKLCFKCKSCGKGLDSTTVRDNEGSIYCNACHGKLFGPKGYGFGQGAGTLVNTA